MNTPLKIYSYLASGRPIVATRITSHTQVLTTDVAVLTDPTPEGLATGICRLLLDQGLAEAIGKQAKTFAEARFSHAAYLTKVREAYDTFAEVSGRA